MALLFLAGMALRMIAIAFFPIVFGGDAVLRLASRERILFGYQLPLLSTVLYLLNLLTPNLTLARIAMSIGGALSGVGFYCFASHVLRREAALAGALLCTAHPYLLRVSTVPYQESWMLAGLLFAFHFFLAGKHWEAALSLGLACLTRYEAWASCPVLAIAYGLGRGSYLQGALLYGWAPLLWMGYQHGLTPSGGFAVESAISWERLWRYPYLAWIALRETPWLEDLVAAAGVVVLWKRRATLWRILLAPACAFALFLAAIYFSAHGTGPNPARFLSSREASAIMAAVVVLAGFGLEMYPRARTATLCLALAWSGWTAWRGLQREDRTPELALSYSLALHLDPLLSHGEKALILAPPLDPALLKGYLDQALKTGGAQSLEAAKNELDQTRLEPSEFLRTVLQSNRPPDRFLTITALRFWRGTMERVLPAPGSFQYLAVWSSYQPASDTERSFAQNAISRSRFVDRISSGPLSVVIYRAEQ